MSESLILIDGWDVTIPAAAEQSRQSMLSLLESVDVEGQLPANGTGQCLADEIAAAMSQAKAWMAEVERVSKELREPYFQQSKKIKAASDTFVMPLAEVLARLGRKLAEYEAEKKRIEANLERQRQEEAARLRRGEEARQRAAEDERRRQEQAERERLAEIERATLAESNAKRRAELEAEAERERQRQATSDAEREKARLAEQEKLATIDNGGLRYEAPKTEGVSVKVSFEFEITDPLALANFAKQNGRGWINQERFCEAFFKRDITEYINCPGVDLDIPGLAIRRAVATTVKRAKGPRTLNVASTSVSL